MKEYQAHQLVVSDSDPDARGDAKESRKRLAELNAQGWRVHTASFVMGQRPRQGKLGLQGVGNWVFTCWECLLERDVVEGPDGTTKTT